MRRVFVGRALILFGRLAEILVLEEKVRELIVDRRRIGVRRERVKIAAVPLERLAIICELLAPVRRVLILGVIMRCEVLQVCLQVGQHLR